MTRSSSQDARRSKATATEATQPAPEAAPRIRPLVPMERKASPQRSAYSRMRRLVCLTVICSAIVFAFYAVTEAQTPIKRAVRHTERVREWRRIVDERMETIKTGLQDVELPVIARQEIAAEQLREVIPPLRSAGVWLSENFVEFERDIRALDASLERSSPTLIEAANHYREIAGKETDETISKQYERLAVQAEGLAEQRATERTNLVAETARVTKKVEFVRRSLVFLDDLETFLGLFDSDDSARVSEYLRELEAYLDAYEDVFTTFQDLRALSGPDDVAATAPLNPATSTVPTASVQP